MHCVAEWQIGGKSIAILASLGVAGHPDILAYLAGCYVDPIACPVCAVM